jgi:hypothetical protein
LNGFDILEVNYKKINTLLLNNFNFSDDYVRTNFLNDFFIIKDFELYQEIEFINKKVKNHSLDIEDTIKILTEFLSTKVFYNLSKVHITEVTHNDSYDYEFEKYVIKIDHKYLIHFLFPKIHEHSFHKILEHNKKFIKDEISKIFKHFNQKDLTSYLLDDDDLTF